MTVELDNLAAEIARSNATAEASNALAAEAVRALKDLKAQVASLAGDPAALQALADSLKAETDAVTAADAGLAAELHPAPPVP